MWHHQTVECLQHMIARYRMMPTAQTRMVINSSWQEVQKEMDAIIKQMEQKHKHQEENALENQERRSEIFRSDRGNW